MEKMVSDTSISHVLLMINKEYTPVFLRNRIYIDLSKEEKRTEEYEKRLRCHEERCLSA